MLMTQESQDTLNILILALVDEITQLLWLHDPNVFCPSVIDDQHQTFSGVLNTKMGLDDLLIRNT